MQTPTSAPSRQGFTIRPFAGTVTVSFSDAIVASSDRVIVLDENGHEPVFYIPFEDIYFEFLHKTDASSHCPLKGQASYWRVSAVGEAADKAMWAYETPIASASAIAGYGAFDATVMRIEAIPAPDRLHAPRLVE